MLDSLQEFYRDKKILITGHTGFKGAWLTLWLTRLGAAVMGFSLAPPSHPCLFEAIGLDSIDSLTNIQGDIRHFAHVQKSLADFAPDMIFHLAAQPLVRLSYEDPRTTYETNIMGTLNILEAVRNTPSVHVLINVTSDKCYENQEWLWGYRENDPLGGHDPYSSSKACAELVTFAYLRSFFPPEQFGRKHRVALASARAGNVVGGGDWGKDRLVPDCIRALNRNENEKVLIRNPQSIRPWQHVLEPLSGYLLLGELLWKAGPSFAGAWNFGPMDSEVWSVNEVVQNLYGLWGKPSPKVPCRTPHASQETEVMNEARHEARYLKLDCSKARMELGWKPRYSVATALRKTIKWYKVFYDNHSMKHLREYTWQQIEEYCSPHLVHRI